MTIQLHTTLPDGRTFASAIHQIRRGQQWSMLSDPQGTKTMGFLMFVDMLNDDSGAVTLFPNNAACLPNGKGHCGEINFRSIRLILGGKWQAEREYGPSELDLVPDTGIDHLMSSGRGLVFRLAIWRGEGRRAAVALLNRGSFLSEPATRWGPAQTRLPSIAFDYETQEASLVSRLRAALSLGTRDDSVDLRRGALGPWHLPGSELAYEYGGFEIHMPWGWRRAKSSYLRHRLISDRWAERVFWCLNAVNGEPMDSETFAVNGRQPFEMYADGNAYAMDTNGRHTNLPPAFDVPPFNAGKCPYAAQLRRIEGVDIAHDVRCQGHAWAVRSLGGDQFTDFFLRAHTNYVRMAWTEIGRFAAPWEKGKDDYRSSLSSMIERATKNPGRGGGDRRLAWTFANACVMYWVAPTEAERRKAAGWLRALLQYDALASMPDTGLVGNFGPGGIAGAWDPKTQDGAGIPLANNATQCFHEGLRIYWVLAAMKVLGQLEPGLLASARRLFNPNLRSVKKAADSMWFNPKLTWKGGPPHYVTTATNGVIHKEITDPGYGAPSAPYDTAHVEPCLARMYSLLGDTKYRARLKDVGSFATEAAKRDHCRAVVIGQKPGDSAWLVEALAALS